MEWLPDENPGLLIKVTSKAGLGNSTEIQWGKQLRMMFDVGQCTETSAACSLVFVSRSNLDHIGGLFLHARLRSIIAKDSPATYYVPQYCLKELESAKKAFENMDTRERTKLPMTLKGVKAGDVIDIGTTFRMHVFETSNRVPSVGYALFKRSIVTKKKYAKLKPAEKGELGRKGVSLTEEVWENKVAYTGEPSMSRLLKTEDCMTADILICQVTLLGSVGKSDTVDHAKELGLLHLDEFIAGAKALAKAPVLRIIMSHLSMRYTSTKIIGPISDNIPDNLRDKIIVATASFGFPDLYLGDLKPTPKKKDKEKTAKSKSTKVKKDKKEKKSKKKTKK